MGGFEREKMSDEPRAIDPSDLPNVLKTRPFSVIHLDATWNGQRFPVQQRIDLLVDKLDDTSFGYIDVDKHQEYVRGIGIRNVPSCSYYRGSDLVATVIGMQQDVEENLRIIRSGGSPDTSNVLSRM